MSRADRERRMLAACYREYGVPAQWDGVASPVTVRHVFDDESMPLGGGHRAQRRNLIFVRTTEVVAPLKNDTVALGAVIFRVMRDPQLEEGGLEWRCEAEEVA